MAARFIALLFLVPGLLPAQDAGSASKKGILLRFTGFGLPDPGKEFVLRAGESTSEPFAIPGNGFSLPLEAPAKSRSLELGVPGQGAEAPFESLLSLQLPAPGKRFLVIVMPAEKRLRATVLRADDPDFHRGDVMIFNLAPEAIAADLGGDRRVFQPGSRTPFRPKKQGDAPNYQVSFYTQRDGKPRIFAANMWPYFDHKRAFVFLYVDPASKRPTYRSVDEFTEWIDDLRADG